jgi:hypothetical protein
MRIGLKLIGIGIMVFLVSSCDIAPRIPTATWRPDIAGPKPGTGLGMRVAVVPFADYTPYSFTYGYWNRNTLMIETMKEKLLKEGIFITVGRDVIDYLLQERVIRKTGSSTVVSERVSYYKSELEEGKYTEHMEKEIEEILVKNMTIKPTREEKPVGGQKGLEPLDREMLISLGKAFQADFIVRGRIMAINFRQEDTFYPSTNSTLSFLFKIGDEIVFAKSDVDTYEVIDGGLPHVINEMSVTWWNRPHRLGGFTTKPLVRLSMIVHDAKTGHVVWRDTAEGEALKVDSFTNMAENEERGAPFTEALRNATSKLVKDFVKTSKVEGWGY